MTNQPTRPDLAAIEARWQGSGNTDLAAVLAYARSLEKAAQAVSDRSAAVNAKCCAMCKAMLALRALLGGFAQKGAPAQKVRGLHNKTNLIPSRDCACSYRPESSGLATMLLLSAS